MATRQAVHIKRKQIRARQRKLFAAPPSSDDGQMNTRVSKKKADHKSEKRPASFEDYLYYMLPDKDWKPIPFADADVEPAELEDAKDKAIVAMSEWGVMVEASRASGIGRDRLYQYRKEDKIFHRRMQVAYRNCIERVEREMIRRGMIPKGELAAIFVLKHNKKRYQEVQRVELTGKGGGPVAYQEGKAELLKKLEHLALKSMAVDAEVVGGQGSRGPRLLKEGGSSDAEGVQVKRVTKAGSPAIRKSSR